MENKIDLTHVKISYPDKPSRESQIIHQWSVLNRYIKLGVKREDFPAEDERILIDTYEKLSEEDKKKEYAILEKEFFSL
jgi:hypothetical protein